LYAKFGFNLSSYVKLYNVIINEMFVVVHEQTQKTRKKPHQISGADISNDIHI